MLSRMGHPPAETDPLELCGDAEILLTAPFFPSANPLAYRPPCAVPRDGVIDAGGRLAALDRSMGPLLRGTLTYGEPQVEVVTHFAGAEAFNAKLCALVDPLPSLSPEVTLAGLLFPDGYGSVAVRIAVPGGWESGRREALLEQFGPPRRHQVADELRTAILPALAELSARCCEGAGDETVFPYFNLTYVAATSHPRPGRATLPDGLRRLVYPRSPAPIASDSPWSDEFFYAGYAYSMLASAAPGRVADQLELLLLQLDVLYARMDRCATSADRMVRDRAARGNVDWMVDLDQRLRADYQALMRPTFSFDYHVLKLRDSLLRAWETDRLRERTDTLLQMARQAVERQLAHDQARRVARVNLIVMVLTLLSLIVTADAALDLWTRLLG